MTHAEFVAAYREGRLEVQIDKAAAARLVSARRMLPLVLLPLFGGAVAVARLGHVVGGARLILAAIGLRYAGRR
ncbi:MAG: hypothetical protein AB7S87_12585, partial [Burkholderiales bacterium]